MSISRLSFVDNEFCGKVSVANLQTSLSNVKFIPKELFLSMGQFIPYEDCEQFHCAGNSLPEDSQCLFISHRWPHDYAERDEMSRLQYEVCEQFLDAKDINFVWVDYSCIPSQQSNDYEALTSNVQTALLSCTYTLIIPNILTDQFILYSDLEDLLTRGWCNFEAFGAMFGMSKTFLALKYGESTTFYELMPWLQEGEEELSYDALITNVQRLRLGMTQAYKKAAKMAISKVKLACSRPIVLVDNEPVLAPHSGKGLAPVDNEQVEVVAGVDPNIPAQVLSNWQRAGVDFELLDLLDVLSEAVEANGSAAMAMTIPIRSGAAKELSNSLGKFSVESDRARVTNLLINLAAFCYGKFWSVRRRMDQEIRDLLADSHERSRRYTSYNLSRKDLLAHDIIKGVGFLGTSPKPWAINLSHNTCGVSGAQSIGQMMGNYGNALTSLILDDVGLGVRGLEYLCKGLDSLSCHLHYLSICNNDIQSEGAKLLEAVLTDNKVLLHLDISKNAIRDEGMSAIARGLLWNQKLTKLESRENDIGEEGLEALAMALLRNFSLRTLDLKNNSFGPNGAGVLATALKFNHRLKRIRLSANGMQEFGLQNIVGALHVNTSLKELVLWDSGIAVEGCIALAQCLQENTTLTALDLYKNQISDDGMVVLCESLLSNFSIQYLSLRRNHIGVGGISRLATILKKNFALNCLDLCYNDIGNEGARMLAEGLVSNPHLTLLSLAGSSIGSEGIKFIAELLCTNNTISELDISSNDLGNEGVTAISDALAKNTGILCLSLSNTGMEDEGAAALAAGLQLNSFLKYLNIRKNKIGDSGCKALQAMLLSHPSIRHVRFEEPLRLSSNSLRRNRSKSRSRTKMLHEYLRKSSKEYNAAWLEKQNSFRSWSSQNSVRRQRSNAGSSNSSLTRSLVPSDTSDDEDDWKAHVGCLGSYYPDSTANCQIQ